MIIPKTIKSIVKDLPYSKNEIGMSGATILMYENYVLKISKDPLLEKEATIMRWLESKKISPKVICFEKLEDTYYLLMTRLKGKMLCDVSYLENQTLLVKLLVEGLYYLWQLDVQDCPIQNGLDDLLKQAKYRVDHDLVDVSLVDPRTFGKEGFANPKALYEWLVENRVEEDLVVCHGDYCLPNIFGKDKEFLGFIDIGHLHVGDKWQDIALCYRSLRDNMNGSYGGKVYNFNPDILFDMLNIKKDEKKLNYYLLLDELF